MKLSELQRDEQIEKRAMRSYLLRRNWHPLPDGRWRKPDDWLGYDEMNFSDAYDYAVRSDVQ